MIGFKKECRHQYREAQTSFVCTSSDYGDHDKSCAVDSDFPMQCTLRSLRYIHGLPCLSMSMLPSYSFVPLYEFRAIYRHPFPIPGMVGDIIESWTVPLLPVMDMVTKSQP